MLADKNATDDVAWGAVLLATGCSHTWHLPIIEQYMYCLVLVKRR